MSLYLVFPFPETPAAGDGERGRCYPWDVPDIPDAVSWASLARGVRGVMCWEARRGRGGRRKPSQGQNSSRQDPSLLLLLPIWQNQSRSSALGTRSSLTGLPPYGFWACFPLAIWCPFADTNDHSSLLARPQRLLLPRGGSPGRLPLQGGWRDEVTAALLHLQLHPAMCLTGRRLLCMCQPCWIIRVLLGAHESWAVHTPHLDIPGC